MIRKPAKDGLGNNVRDHIYDPVDNGFVHKDELVHVSSYDMKSKEPKLGSPEHKHKFPDRYKSGYVDWWNRDKNEKTFRDRGSGFVVFSFFQYCFCWYATK